MRSWKVRTTAVLAVAGAAATATAGPGAAQTVSGSAIYPQTGVRGIGPYGGTGFEASEGFVVGPLPQGGWVLGVGDAGYEVVATNKNGSVNSLFMTKNTAAGQGNQQLAFSPINTDGTRQSVCFDIKMDDAAGADYNIIGQSPTQGFLTWQVDFSYTGNILVVGPDTTGALGFRDTGVAWAQFQWKTFRVDVVNEQSRIDYFYDGNLIFQTPIFGGTINEQIVLVHDNFQDFAGNTSISGGPIGAYLDNLEIKPIPSPGALALLGLGGLAMARRRRA